MASHPPIKVSRSLTSIIIRLYNDDEARTMRTTWFVSLSSLFRAVLSRYIWQDGEQKRKHQTYLLNGGRVLREYNTVEDSCIECLHAKSLWSEETAVYSVNFWSVQEIVGFFFFFIGPPNAHYIRMSRYFPKAQKALLRFIVDRWKKNPYTLYHALQQITITLRVCLAWSPIVIGFDWKLHPSVELWELKRGVNETLTSS